MSLPPAALKSLDPSGDEQMHFVFLRRAACLFPELSSYLYVISRVVFVCFSFSSLAVFERFLRDRPCQRRSFILSGADECLTGRNASTTVI